MGPPALCAFLGSLTLLAGTEHWGRAGAEEVRGRAGLALEVLRNWGHGTLLTFAGSAATAAPPPPLSGL